jgi:hypothetical protein
MKAFKWVALGCGAAAVLGVAACAGLIWWAYSLTKPAADAGDQFFALLADGKTHEAYQAAAAPWRAREDEETFTAGLRQLGLTDCASVQWDSRSINNNERTLGGTMTTKQGGTVPLTVKLVQEGGQWKVLSVTQGREAK